MKQIWTLIITCLAMPIFAQVNFTANNQVTPYTGAFRPGINMGYNPGWENQQLANIAVGNATLNQKGIGAKSIRQGVYEEVLEIYGYNLAMPDFTQYGTLGAGEHVAIIGGPVAWHKDFNTSFCQTPGEPQYNMPSELFGGLYLPIWDGGANGTPYNDNNYAAAYFYKVVNQYKDVVRFWEVWNEPGLDYKNVGWRDQNYPGNWWLEGPTPCSNILNAPLYHYIRTMRIAYEVIHSLDPDGYVCLGSVGYQSYLNALLRNTDNPNNGDVSAEYPLGGGAYFDCISFHSYPHFDGSTTNFGANFFERHSDEAADGVFKYRDYYQQILDQYGYNGVTYPKKEWIITEINSPRKAYTGTYFAGADAQVNHIMKAFMISKINKIHQMHTYQLFDQKTDAEATYEFHQMGLYKKIDGIGPYGQTVNDQGKALKTLGDLIYNTQYDAARTAAMNLPAGARGYAWKKPDGTYIYSIWARTTEDLSEAAFATYSFPASFNLTNVTKYTWDYGYSGTTQSISANNIQLDAKPVFFTGGGAPPVCVLNAAVANIVCNDNGTPSNPADDTFTATMNISSAGASTGWTATINGQTVTGTYGTPKALGPFLITGGSLFFTVRDASNANCATEVSITAPAACSNGGGNPVPYCASVSAFPWHEWIAKVQVGTINNTSGKTPYTDYTAQTTTLANGTSHPISLTTGFSYLTFNENWRVWIDFNKNGVFEATEKVYEGTLAAPANGTATAVTNGSLVIPAGAATGATRMRVSMKRGAYADPCEAVPFGEVEDYTVNITGGGGGNPCAINAVVSGITCNNNGTNSNAADDTYSFSVTVTGTNASTGWTATINGATVTGTYGTPKSVGPFPIGGGNQTFTVRDNTTATCTASATATAPPTCSTGGGGNPVPYCASTSAFPWHEWIANVKLGTINTASGKSAYSDFTNQSTALTIGTASPIVLTTGFSYATANQNWKVWIDYNKNGVFEEPSELAFQGVLTAPTPGTATAVVNGNITVPAGTAAGSTRMRVSMKNGGSPTPCETLPFGEVEDYTVSIQTFNNLVAPSDLEGETAGDDVFFFEVSKQSEGVRINWVDYNDSEVARFIVQKSLDGRNWKTIEVIAAQSNRAQAQNYETTDLTPNEGNNFYRIETVKINGLNSMTQERKLNIRIPAEFGIYPNPAQNNITVDMAGFTGRNGTLSFFNTLGVKVKEINLTEQSVAMMNVNLSDLSEGQYFVQIAVEGKRASTQRLVINN
jgi:GEVED domain/Secretion system C-terminal sorting domain